ncbi:SDR family NAD(P)-dependent oxidoreductase [Halovulum dunhuangense]|uniref:SDR family NAD(P)-dependent oxidoreductase n=1 Tax=Halovulum dunhuangense TaxID=1505036 RepID=A0A849L2J6_9RHOB|nr:SDR family NAD(P)-dependent oxidoreductase [Halovulum dunhuangense]NNU80464.1 SDR family NAD(P)-dependent oxidoreductase [Halovulum dunhuangense]
MRIGEDTPAIISGGASGLGAETARILAAAGAPVTILDLNPDTGAELAESLGGLFLMCDVTDSAAVADALSAAAAVHGPARIAVACAGIAPGARTVAKDGSPHDPALFDRVIAVNLMGTFHLVSQAAAQMGGLAPMGRDAERGAIVTTASVAAFEGQIGQIGYAASKGAVAAMTLPMARDLAALGIRVNSIAPGLFRTPMVAGLPPQVQESLGASVPFPPRLGDPAEFASLVRHMIENPMMNGAVVRLDGAIRMAPK